MKNDEEETQKIVNAQEWYNRRADLFWQELSVGEKLFQAFIDTPHKAYLFVRQGIEEAVDGVKRDWRKEAPAPVRGYDDALSGDVYIPQSTIATENAYAQKHGLSKKFQEKAARISQRAFDECRDFSVLKKIGQLRPIP